MNIAAEQYVMNWVSKSDFHSLGSQADAFAALTSEATRFLGDIVIEALTERRFESSSTLPPSYFLPNLLEIDEQAVSELLSGTLGTSVTKVVAGAHAESMARHFGSPVMRTGSPKILLIDVLVAINKDWCKVWPFCKAAELP